MYVFFGFVHLKRLLLIPDKARLCAQVDAASKIQHFWRQKTEAKEKAKEAKAAKGKKPSKEKASPHTSPKAPLAARPSQGRCPWCCRTPS